MPIIMIERDDATQRMVARASGPLSADALLSFVAEHRTGRAREYALMLDFRNVTVMPSERELWGFAAVLTTLAKSAPRGPVAIVATAHAVFGAARQLELLCEAGDVGTVRAYRTIDEAERWLTAGWLA